MSTPQIKKLLSHPNNDASDLERIKRVMKKYIASPWDSVNNKILDEIQYKEYLNEYKNKFEKGINNKKVKLCLMNTDDDTIKKYKQILCQGHSGNLFEHSQWSALQILKWYIDKDPIMDELDLETTLVAAFFHDIGKGGDCNVTCNENSICWFDIYSNNKYDKKGDAVHPTYCSDVILGKIPFIVDCSKNESIYINKLIAKEYPTLNINEIALAALMHWEFGKLNMGGDMEIKIKKYLDTFFESCTIININPSEKLLRLCIAVACADITAGRNIRLVPSVDGIKPADEVFLGKDPFVLFGMDKKYLSYRESLLKAFSNKSNKEGTIRRKKSKSKKKKKTSKKRKSVRK